MIHAGIDAGSRTIKVVLHDAERGETVGAGVLDQGVEQNALAQRLFNDVLQRCDLPREAVRSIVATGYGRKLLTIADAAITEITCQAAGVAHAAPGARMVVDIGGQDSKLLRLGDDGAVRDFVMNDRCAAGTGRFLEVVATRLGVPFANIGELAARSASPARISNMCVVFAETEIVGLLASGVTREDILAGVQASIATRVAAMAGGRIAGPIVFTGGGALATGMPKAIETAFGHSVAVAPDPQLTCALGAAILASRRK